MSGGQRALSWILRLSVAGILLQTLFFKFTGAAESVYIFEAVGAEPWGRYGSGAAELIASVLLLAPGTVGLGALIALVVISGAVGSHFAVLGIEVMGDGGLLFYLALYVLVASAILLVMHRRSIPIIGSWFSSPVMAPGGRR